MGFYEGITYPVDADLPDLQEDFRVQLLIWLHGPSLDETQQVMAAKLVQPESGCQL